MTATPTTEPPAQRPGSRRSGWILLALTVALGLAGDLVSKHLAFEHLAPTPVHPDREAVIARMEHGIPLNVRGPINPAALVRQGIDVNEIPEIAFDELIPEHEPTTAVPAALDLVLILNPGAVFGSAPGARWVFVGFTLFALTAALWVFATQIRTDQRLAQIGVGLVIAGGLGNLYDRLRFASVRDFLNFFPRTDLPFGIAWPSGATEFWPYVSNVADKLLLVGIAILLWTMWRSGAKQDPTAEDTEIAEPKSTAPAAEAENS